MSKSIKNTLITITLLVFSYWMFIDNNSPLPVSPPTSQTPLIDSKNTRLNNDNTNANSQNTVAIPEELPPGNPTYRDDVNNSDLPEDLKAQLNAPPPELPEDLKRQLEMPPQELPDDLKAQLKAPPPELPDDIKEALKKPPRVVTIEEVNGVSNNSGDE